MSEQGRHLEYLAERIGGTHHKASGKHAERVVATVQGYSVTLDTVRTPLFATHTRYRARFVAPEPFAFRLSPPDFDTATTLRRTLGKAADVQIGVPYFDDKYLIEATDGAKMRQFLDDPVLRQQIGDLGKFYLELRTDKDFPANHRELRLLLTGKTEEIARLQYLFDLMGIFLSRLEDLGCLSETVPLTSL
ncbi:MAG: hypothetical protein OHK0029_36630 [Armatimonadaceae bacterium]